MKKKLYLLADSANRFEIVRLIHLLDPILLFYYVCIPSNVFSRLYVAVYENFTRRTLKGTK